jgi:hypothetical protein
MPSISPDISPAQPGLSWGHLNQVFAFCLSLVADSIAPSAASPHPSAGACSANGWITGTLGPIPARQVRYQQVRLSRRASHWVASINGEAAPLRNCQQD